jgi:ATP phosphoribosyltransferase regulatory subunit
VPILLEQMPVRDKAGLRHALDHKDAQRVATAAGGSAALFMALLAAVGPAPQALEALASLDLPGQARQEVSRLKTVVALIGEAAPALALTIDPVEHRGFEYQTGISFSIFVAGVRGELGRGGRYAAGAGEPATGFTLAMESVLRALPEPSNPKRVYLPAGTPADVAATLRGQGWMALSALDPASDAEAEARRLGCTHVCRDGRPVELT